MSNQRYEYDALVIGLGPAGMAVSIMAAEMGLRVAAIESHKIGGECMNVGCIPSKALLRIAKVRTLIGKSSIYALTPGTAPRVLDPFNKIQADIRNINDNKTVRMFEKVDLILGQGKAAFVDRHTVAVGDRRITARRIYICTGTRPALPPIKGLDPARVLTNENLFHQSEMPASMLVIGSGAIAMEMAQAFARLGTKVTMVMRGPGLMWREDSDAFRLIEDVFEKEGITLLRNRNMLRVEHLDGMSRLETAEDGVIEAEKILVATGRRFDFDALKLENAGIKHDKAGITVDKYLRTTAGNIFAPGDCNGHHQFSHAAMHQGMIAIINSLMPGPFRRDFRRYVVPWTVFTDPPVSWVGPREQELRDRGVRFETIRINYSDYGAAIAENVDIGFVKALVTARGRILAAGVVGEGSGESINEWGLAIQTRRRMTDILFLQHSFPSMSFLNKRVAETWMVNRMKSNWLTRIARLLYRW